MREYKKDKDSKIDNLADIAKTVTHLTGMPKEEIHEHWNIGNDTKWGVFIPNNIWKYKAVSSKLSGFITFMSKNTFEFDNIFLNVSKKMLHRN